MIQKNLLPWKNSHTVLTENGEQHYSTEYDSIWGSNIVRQRSAITTTKNNLGGYTNLATVINKLVGLGVTMFFCIF